MSDLIDRQAAIDALARMMPRSYTPDGSHPADEEIFRAQEVFADCIEALEILPSAQPATNCSEIPNGSDDTISRQAAIDALDDYILGDSVREILEQLPAAQPELPEWVQKVEEYRTRAPKTFSNPLAWAFYQAWKEYSRKENR